MYRQSSDDLGSVIEAQGYGRTFAIAKLLVGVPCLAIGLWAFHAALRETAILIGVVVIVLIGLSRLAELVRWRSIRIEVHQHGLTFNIPGQGGGRYRWNDLVAITSLVPNQRAPGGKRAILVVGGKRASFALRFNDGCEAFLPLDTVEAPDRVQNAIVTQSMPTVLERARAALSRGESVDFGAIVATPRGLVPPRANELPWTQVADVRPVASGPSAGMLQLVDANGELLAQALYSHVPNVPLLQALVAERRRHG
jgi:hypothetical protein